MQEGLKLHDSNPCCQHLYRQLIAHLQEQNRWLAQLERHMSALISELSTRPKDQPVTIEKIEYHFDQLKVESLEGTLHIGVQPGMEKEQPFFTQTFRSQLHDQVKKQMLQYIDEVIPDQIRLLQQKHQCVLGDDYVREMIQDLKNQVDDRITYYINHPALPANDVEKVRFVYEYTIADIERSVEHHFQQLSHSEKEGGHS